MRVGILGSGLMGASSVRSSRELEMDAGPLRIAATTEPFALLVGELAYNGQAGPELAYRFERFSPSPKEVRDGNQKKWFTTFQQRTGRIFQWRGAG
jgi:hypothetical protein